MRMRVVFLGLLLIIMFTASGCAKKNTDSTTPKPVNRVEPSEPTDSSAQMMTEAEAEAAISANRIYFAFDKYDLHPDAQAVLKAKAMILKNFPSWKILIEGHCDNRGTEEYNIALGERRARAAYEYLVMLGVPASNLKIISFGENQPLEMGANEAAWAKNRRCEFKIFK